MKQQILQGIVDKNIETFTFIKSLADKYDNNSKLST